MSSSTRQQHLLPTRPGQKGETVKYDPKEKTAVLLVNGFNGLGLHTLFSIIRLFGGTFRNFVFVQVGVADAGSFKGAEELSHLKAEVKQALDRYVSYMRSHGYYAASYTSFGTDVVDEVDRIMPADPGKVPQCSSFRRTAGVPDNLVPVQPVP